MLAAFAETHKFSMAVAAAARSTERESYRAIANSTTNTTNTGWAHTVEQDNRR